MTGISANNIFKSVGSQFANNCGNMGEISRYIDINQLVQTMKNGGSIESALEQMGLSLSQLPMDMIQKLLSEVMSMLGGACDFTQEANEEVKRNNDAIQNKAKDIDLTRRTGNEKIDAVLENIEKNVKTVEEAIKELQKLQKNTEEELKSQQEEIEKKQEEAQEQVKILNSKTSTTQEKRKALQQISDINSFVELKANVLSGWMKSQNARIQAENTIVEKATKEIADGSAKAIEEINTTLDTINKKAGEGVTDGIKDMTKTAADGATDVVKGTAGEVAAKGLEMTPYTATEGAQLEKASADKIAAGGVKLSGVGSGLTQIGSLLQQKGTAYADVAKWTTILGEANTAAASKITAYGDLSLTILSSTITSIGSISTNLKTEVATVETQIQTYDKYLQEEEKSSKSSNTKKTENVDMPNEESDMRTNDYRKPVFNSSAKTIEFKNPEYKKCFETSAK